MLLRVEFYCGKNTQAYKILKVYRKQLAIKTRLLYFVFFLFNIALLNAQTALDSIKIMSYNVGNFGIAPTTSCPLLNINTKSAYLRTIISYENPDIIGLVKMNADANFCTNTVLTNVLNPICNGCWGSGSFSTVSTYTKADMLYFKTNKFGFKNSTVIYSADPNISDIKLHKLYFKSPNLATTHDTIFLKIVVAHLKSGSGNASDRATEIGGAMSWLNANTTTNENIIFMGDFNTTSSNESCFQKLINSTNPITKFYDPANQLGDWSANPNIFAHWMTQSTRTSDPGDCLATGGLNDRFDHILISSSLKNGTNSLGYIAGTYQVVGQDGNHVGAALIDSPTNISVPSTVNNALYYMSEHLPVVLKLVVNNPSVFSTNSIADLESQISITPNPSTAQFKVLIPESIKIDTIKVFTLMGAELVSESVTTNPEINLSQFSKGIYFIQLIDEYQNYVFKKVVLQ